MNNSKIDFVMLWVDDKDEEWLKEKQKYTPNTFENLIVNTNNRYRDWENLKYWFRGVEKFAPWVNNIYFITYGHLPKWLNINNPKLKVIKHEEFMNKEFLPTFNSNAIELNLHKIESLSENFVLFNDDVFIIDDVKESDFFENDMPRDEFAENPIIPGDDTFPHTLFNNMEIINKYYNKRKVEKENIWKYYNIKYGKNNIRTLLLAPFSRYIGIYNPHICTSFKKSYLKKVWDLEYDRCVNTSKTKFRSKENITQYLVRYFQLMDGNFIPRKSNFGKLLELSDKNIDSIVKYISKQKGKVVCVNDNDMEMDFNMVKNKLNQAFEEILPNKSSFEV